MDTGAGRGAALEALAHPHLYRSVPLEQLVRFVEFRRAHPLERLEIASCPWSYIVSGHGPDTVLVLPAALGTAESAWSSIARFEMTHRVVCASYPPVPTMAALVDGLVALLGHLQCDTVQVVGASYGGLVAQVLIRRHPMAIRDLVLSHTTCPDTSRGAKIESARRWVNWLPMSLLRTILRKKLSALVPASLPEASLLHACMRDALAHDLTKRDLIMSYRRVADFDRLQFAPADLTGWPGRVLLLMADDDPATPPDVRDQLTALYPGARVRVFQGTSHATPLLEPDAYYGEIERFLAARDMQGRDCDGVHSH
jgi:pimeloyl-ACP methyl ester carboxylesterase